MKMLSLLLTEKTISIKLLVVASSSSSAGACSSENSNQFPISLIAWIFQSHFNPKDFCDVSRIDQRRKSRLEILQSREYLYWGFSPNSQHSIYLSLEFYYWLKHVKANIFVRHKYKRRINYIYRTIN